MSVPVKVRLKMIEVLQQVLAGDRNPHKGLCWHLHIQPEVENFADLVEEYLHNAFCKWLGFSGCIDYPVGENPEISEINFNDSEIRGTMYDGEYGQQRLDLAQFLVDSLKEELAEEGVSL